jgi:hypothetical protein
MRIALVSVRSRADQVRRDERRPKAVMKCRRCAISVPSSLSYRRNTVCRCCRVELSRKERAAGRGQVRCDE